MALGRWWNGEALVGDFSRPPVAVELYAHAGDTEAAFDTFENRNVAGTQTQVVAQHMALARARWDKGRG
jgi:hypothetical protein